ncbi:tumor necrosis factor receptor superfamily member 8 [Lissotriton helveticus]
MAGLAFLLLLLAPGVACKELHPVKDPATYDWMPQKVCIKCPLGNVQRNVCPQDVNLDCKSQCDPGHYVDWSDTKPHCRACVTCSEEDHLVEKISCSSISERMCECQPGMFCVTPVRSTCARCRPHSKCPPGSGVRNKGTAQKNTVCEKCSPGTFSNTSSTEACLLPTGSASTLPIPDRNGSAECDKTCKDPPPLVNTPSVGPTHPPITGSSGFLYIGAATVCVLSVVLAVLLIWRQKSRRVCLLPLGCCGWPLDCCRTCHLEKVEVYPEIRRQESCQDLSESDSLIGVPEVHSSWTLDQADLVESDGTLQDGTRGMEQTNNRIEAIYIMKADTVIVGSVSEAPRSQSANLRRSKSYETLHDPHYPLQESDPPRSANVTLSVEEEEGKRSLEPSLA